jgi:pyruvate formate lyase activating enzyme
MLIGGFLPFSLSDYPGKSAAILFTQGCNYRCPFCHNRSLWPMTADQPPAHTTETILEFMAGRKGLLQGLVVTGGEPTLQGDIAEFFSNIKKLGFSVKLDTNGSQPEVIADLLVGGLVDYAAMDIKAPLEKYDALCGLPTDTRAIVKSIELISQSRVPHHFRTTIFPPLISDKDLADLKRLLPPDAGHVTQAFRPVPGMLHALESESQSPHTPPVI